MMKSGSLSLLSRSGKRSGLDLVPRAVWPVIRGVGDTETRRGGDTGNGGGTKMGDTGRGGIARGRGAGTGEGDGVRGTVIDVDAETGGSADAEVDAAAEVDADAVAIVDVDADVAARVVVDAVVSTAGGRVRCLLGAAAFLARATVDVDASAGCP